MPTWEKTHSDMGHLEPPTIKVKRLRPWAKLPVKATEGAACFDIHFCPEHRPDFPQTLLKPAFGFREVFKLETGLAFEIPQGWEMQLRPRSGLSFKGFGIANSPGTIDADYRGEVAVLAYNSSSEDKVIYPGDRIAQITFRRVPEVKLIEVNELSETERGEGGFGSTGVK